MAGTENKPVVVRTILLFPSGRLHSQCMEDSAVLRKSVLLTGWGRLIIVHSGGLRKVFSPACATNFYNAAKKLKSGPYIHPWATDRFTNRGPPGLHFGGHLPITRGRTISTVAVCSSVSLRDILWPSASRSLSTCASTCHLCRILGSTKRSSHCAAHSSGCHSFDISFISCLRRGGEELDGPTYWVINCSPA